MGVSAVSNCGETGSEEYGYARDKRTCRNYGRDSADKLQGRNSSAVRNDCRIKLDEKNCNSGKARG